MFVRVLLALPLLSALASPSLAGGELFVYPKHGQSQELQDQDRFECHSWAVQQADFDPTHPPQPSAPPPTAEKKKGGVLKGAAGGALLGAAVGAIAGDAGKGAAGGAVAGGAVGGLIRKNQKDQQAQARADYEVQQRAALDQGRARYDRAIKTCLEARGYTVN